MPLALQAKLLRVLQEQEVEPLGSNSVQRVDVRIIAATSRDLAAMVAAGQFRADLYYRLNVLPIRLPALRERLSDLDALTDNLLDDLARRNGMPVKTLSADALERLARHPWPGNIRELRNVLEQAALMTDDLLLRAAHLHGVLGEAPVGGPLAEPLAPTPGAFRVPGAQRLADADPAALPGAALAEATDPGPFKPLPQAIAELESASIRAALHATHGNKLAAARLLGIARATLYEKMNHLGLS
jgi:DNA-binding NtrC family response regulator